MTAADVTAADATAGGKQQQVRNSTVQQRVVVQQQFQQHREEMVFAGRFKCVASIRKEDEPPERRSVQRGNAAGAATDFKGGSTVDLKMAVAAGRVYLFGA